MLDNADFLWEGGPAMKGGMWVETFSPL